MSTFKVFWYTFFLPTVSYGFQGATKHIWTICSPAATSYDGVNIPIATAGMRRGVVVAIHRGHTVTPRRPLLTRSLEPINHHFCIPWFVIINTVPLLLYAAQQWYTLLMGTAFKKQKA